MDELLVYSESDWDLNSKIRIHQPTLREVAKYGEQQYFSLVNSICATPSDRKVDIWDRLHVYWDTVDEYDLFIATFRSLVRIDTSILFPDLDLAGFEQSVNLNTNEYVLRNPDGVVIDRAIHALMTEYLRKVHHLRKNEDYGVNDYTKDIMIEDDRDAMEAAAHKQYRSQLKPLISALVNSANFKYSWETVWDLPVGVFLDSYEQVCSLMSYQALLSGAYSGMLDTKKMSRKLFMWPQPER